RNRPVKLLRKREVFCGPCPFNANSKTDSSEDSHLASSLSSGVGRTRRSSGRFLGRFFGAFTCPPRFVTPGRKSNTWNYFIANYRTAPFQLCYATVFKCNEVSYSFTLAHYDFACFWRYSQSTFRRRKGWRMEAAF